MAGVRREYVVSEGKRGRCGVEGEREYRCDGEGEREVGVVWKVREYRCGGEGERERGRCGGDGRGGC